MAAAVFLSLTLPPRYTASTTVVIDFKGVDPVTGAALPAPLMPTLMATQVDIIKSQAVALRVVKSLKLAEQPEAQQRFVGATEGKGSIDDWLAGTLLRKLDVKPARDSRLAEISYTHADPELAAKVANAFASAFIQTNLDMKVKPAKDSTAWFDGQLKHLREQFENAQQRLSAYQRQKGITTTDQRLDVESARFAELSSQLVQIQNQSYENSSRQKQLEEFISKKRSVDSLPEVLSSPVIQDLKARLSAAEARLSQASGSLGVNHPEYQRAESEVNSLRRKLSDEVSTATSVISNNLRITQSRERELSDALAAQKVRLLEINRNRDELGVLIKEVENAQHAYDAASLRHAETRLESQSDQSNIMVLNPATVPIQPAFPNLLMNLALAVLIGMVLGIVLALAIEVLDRRVRSAEDVFEAIGVPLWGAMEDMSRLSKTVDRKNKRVLAKRQPLRSLQEPTLGKSR